VLPALDQIGGEQLSKQGAEGGGGEVVAAAADGGGGGAVVAPGGVVKYGIHVLGKGEGTVVLALGLEQGE